MTLHGPVRMHVPKSGRPFVSSSWGPLCHGGMARACPCICEGAGPPPWPGPGPGLRRGWQLPARGRVLIGQFHPGPDVTTPTPRHVLSGS
jgi:hypothetical protein